VDAIYLPERTFDMDAFMAKVKHLSETKSSVVIAVSEGIKIADGFYLYRKKLTARQAALLVKLSAQLTGDDLATIDSILRQFAP